MKQKTNIGWVLPQSRSILLQEVKANQILSALWRPPTFEAEKLNQLNASTTLPLEIKPKSELYREVAVENPDKPAVILKFKQVFSYGKLLVKFYKAGVINVWKNNKELKELKNHKIKISNQLDSHGIPVSKKIGKFNSLSDEMAQAIYMSKIENKTYNDNTQGEVIKNSSSNKQIIDVGLFRIWRSQYQLIKRTPQDFLKLPMFAVIFSIFMECTPLLCFAFPEITPLTCILPSLLPRIWRSKSNNQLAEQTKNYLLSEDGISLALKTAFNLPINLVRHLCKSLNLTSKYVPINAYLEPILRQRLQNHYNYLMVDNYFLTGLNGSNSANMWSLSYQELILACLERNLISDVKTLVNQYDRSSDDAEKHIIEEQITNDLRVKLFKFIIDFENYNIGYLCLSEFLTPIDTGKLLQWRKE